MIISVFFPVIQTTKRESAVSLSATRTKKTNAKERETEREREDTVSARAVHTKRGRERGSRRRRSNRAASSIGVNEPTNACGCKATLHSL